MNRKQLVVMWIGIIGLTLALLFPPWCFHDEKSDNDRRIWVLLAGTEELALFQYRFFCSPENPYKHPSLKSCIAFDILLVEIAVIALLTTGLLITFRTKRREGG